MTTDRAAGFPKIMTPEFRVYTCDHEARHAVAAIVFGIPFGGVTVANVGDELEGKRRPPGMTFFDDKQLQAFVRAAPPAEGQRTTRNIVTMYLAGFTPTGKKPPAGQPDAECAWRWATEIDPDAADRVIDEAFADAMMFARDYADAIRAVAAELRGPPKGGTDPQTILSPEVVAGIVRVHPKRSLG
jgi:hypothetical protein